MNRNPADLPKSTNPKEKQEIIELASKQKSDFNNPCIREQELSYKCLSENNYDKKACEVVFANYGCCQKFWTKVRADRRKRGIRPELPWPEHREKVKAEYINKWGRF